MCLLQLVVHVVQVRRELTFDLLGLPHSPSTVRGASYRHELHGYHACAPVLPLTKAVEPIDLHPMRVQRLVVHLDLEGRKPSHGTVVGRHDPRSALVQSSPLSRSLAGHWRKARSELL